MEGKVVRLQTPQGYNHSGVVKDRCKEPRSDLIHSEGKIYRKNGRYILPVAEPAPVREETGLEYMVIKSYRCHTH